jgi:hypothetical protein
MMVSMPLAKSVAKNNQKCPQDGLSSGLVLFDILRMVICFDVILSYFAKVRIVSILASFQPRRA